MLRLRYGDDVILAATHGRGLATAEYELDIYTGLEGSSLISSEINIYPNPASDHFTITGNLPERSSLTITISDLNGRIVYQQNMEYLTGSFETGIDVSDLSNGLYIVKVENGEKSASNKLIIR
jgi:hypothetical protein